jgi:hypothetical protein
MVNQDGVVYQKDLGPNTPAIAQAITAFNPDKTWRVVPKGTTGMRARTAGQ